MQASGKPSNHRPYIIARISLLQYIYISFLLEDTRAHVLHIVGIFVEKAVLAASPDRDDLVLEQRRKARQDADEFRHMCKLLDEGKTGNITWEDCVGTGSGPGPRRQLGAHGPMDPMGSMGP